MSYIGKKVLQYEQEMINDLQELIKINSVASDPLPGKPSGAGVHEALQYVLQLGERLGFRARSVDGYAGHIEFGSGEEIAAVLTHLDTVPLGDGWTYPPLEGRIVDGKIYGRGASDNKFAVIAAIYSLYALKEACIVPSRRMRVIFGTNEETGMTDMDYYFEKEPLPDFSFVTDGPYPITNAEKGSLVIELIAELEEREKWLEGVGGEAPNVIPDFAQVTLHDPTGAQLQLQATGKTGHGAYPKGGINAISLLFDEIKQKVEIDSLASAPLLKFAWDKIGLEQDGHSLGIAFHQEKHGDVSVNVAQFDLKRDRVKLVLDIRFPPGASEVSIIDTIRQVAAGYGLTVRIAKQLPALYVDPDSELINRLGKAYTTVTGEAAELISMAGGTYAKKLRNTGVTFGPAFPGAPSTNFHRADENIGISQLMRHAEVCTQALYELSLY